MSKFDGFKKMLKTADEAMRVVSTARENTKDKSWTEIMGTLKDNIDALNTPDLRDKIDAAIKARDMATLTKILTEKANGHSVSDVADALTRKNGAEGLAREVLPEPALPASAAPDESVKPQDRAFERKKDAQDAGTKTGRGLVGLLKLYNQMSSGKGTPPTGDARGDTPSSPPKPPKR